MKALFHKIPAAVQSSYNVAHNISPNLGNKWHYHPELELHYVVRGEGVRFIGNNINKFVAGEIILLGEYLPHTWRCKDEYFKGTDGMDVETIVIQFMPDCLGNYLLGLPEAFLLPKLFERAKSGMLIHGNASKKIAVLMQSAVNAHKLNKIILLLSIFKILSETKEYDLIITKPSFSPVREPNVSRINKITDFILANYNNEISLEEIASMSHLSVTSFCRYFKTMTKKTFTDYLLEIRISHSCAMIVEDRFSIDIIFSECGFKNKSNFYRHFKKITGITPKEYKFKFFN